MYHLIQRGKVRSQVINIPEGLPELLSDITREVLRCQPTTECLCQFIIDYLHSVIVTRDKARIAKSIIDRALRVVNEVIADMCICDIPQTKAEKMCEAMEECFRRFLAQRRCERGKEKEIIKFKDLDMLDELIKKCKFTEDELKISRPVIEAAYQKFVDAYMTANESADGTDSLYEYFRERELKRMEERLREEAAIKIQSNFRGYLVRKSMFNLTPHKDIIPEEIEDEADRVQKELAAKKIQHFFRRHLKDRLAHEEDQWQDPCKPSSKLSLTARPADHHDLKSDESIEKEKQSMDNTLEEQHDLEEVVQVVESLKVVQDNVVQDNEVPDNEVPDNEVKENEPQDIEITVTETQHETVHEEIVETAVQEEQNE